MAKRRNEEIWQYISVFQKGKLYVGNVLNLQRLSFKIRSKPARKHSTYLHRKLEIIRSFHTANSCRISTLNCLQYTPNAEKTELEMELSILPPFRFIFYGHVVFLCNAADLALSHTTRQSEMANKQYRKLHLLCIWSVLQTIES